jgi:hypothetical protein
LQTGYLGGTQVTNRSSLLAIETLTAIYVEGDKSRQQLAPSLGGHADTLKVMPPRDLLQRY